MASETEFVAANDIKPGHYILLKGKPCKVLEASWSKPGKHGSAKIHFLGMNLLTGKKVEQIAGSTDMMDVPVIKRSDLQIIALDGNELRVLSKDGSEVINLKMPDDAERDRKRIEQALEEGVAMLAVVQYLMGNMIFNGCKEDNRKTFD